MRFNDKLKAIKLRKQGLTYSEIMDKIPNLSKSTLSGWLSNIKLTKLQQDRVLRKQRLAGHSGRLKGAMVNKQKGIINKKIAEEKAKSIYSKNINDSYFKSGIMLYLSEGSKTQKSTVSLSNTDPFVQNFFIHWIINYLDVSRDRLRARIFIHRPYKDEKNWNKLWSDYLGIPMSQFYKPTIKPTPHKLKRKVGHMGCLRISLSSTEVFYQVKYLIELFKREYKLHPWLNG